MFTHWFYIPADSPSMPAEIESIDLNLKKDEIAVTFLSLENGEATLLQSGNGENILVNTGGEGTKEQVNKLLKLYNIEKVSTIILTTSNAYCKSNLEWLLEDYGVEQIIIGKSIARQIKENDESLKETGIHVWDTGTQKQVLPNVNLKVLFEGDKSDEGMDFSVTFFNHRILFMSSTSEAAEKSLLNQELKDVNIIKIPGFGAEPLISEELIEHVDPQYAIIFHKKDVIPDSDFLKMLNDAWIDVFFTKKHGTITVKFTDVNYEVFTILNEEELK